ncbi:hypothetical protein O181_114278 [Austropuccinia psidii MF-1]|uniref:Uncharacterized protein n=1 Tax=Austropuccinia psidii MF-1 TaxID=1389203 RepID=A0A9Q3PUE8_9BASI|nr:hypothetical protein [Austropuccinia psidii MF-1]
MFSQSYANYQNSSNILFPNIRIMPNHHYSMHIPQQLMRWGPLNGISEYGGERLVGLLQKFKSNSLSGSIEETIMKKFGQLQKLQHIKPKIPAFWSRSSIASLKNRKELDKASYPQLLHHLQEENPELRHYDDLPHPQDSRVLQNYVVEHLYFLWRFGLKISKNSPNNLVYVKKGYSNIEFGKIAHIIGLRDDKVHEGPLIMVQWLESVKEQEEGFEEVELFLVEWNIKHLRLKHHHSYVSISEILGLGAYLNLPAWSLGYKDVSIIACPINKCVGLEQFN